MVGAAAEFHSGFYRDIVRIEITAGLLVADDLRHGLIHNGLQCRLPLGLRQIGHTFQPLGHIGVPENMGTVGLPLLPLAAQGVKASRFGKAFINALHRDFPVQLGIMSPKSA